MKKTVGGGKANRKGTPQGGVISPLLANCYLHILDRLWQRRHLKGKLQAHLVRYADDFVVMCRKDVGCNWGQHRNCLEPPCHVADALA